MTRSLTTSFRTARRAWPCVLVLVLGPALVPIGCIRIPTSGDSLAIATSWTETERSEIERAFGRWLAFTPGAPTNPGGIDWIILAPNDDLARIIRRGSLPGDLLWRRPDVMLGGPVSRYAELARRDQLVAIDRPGSPAWCVSRSAPIVLAMNTKVERSRGAVTFDDPRHDPLALAWARRLLETKGWNEGYAELVRSAGHPRRIGRQPRSAHAAVERAEAEATPALTNATTRSNLTVSFVSLATPAVWEEGVGIVKGGSNRGMAQWFLRFLNDRGQASPPRPGTSERPEFDDLLADLLGATLVNAQDELWAAWAILERVGHPSRSEMWMTQAPPWPPASIQRLMDRDPSGELIRTLAGQIAPEPDVAAWLLRSWLGPRRLIDGTMLVELFEAAEGRLVREPRFRAWLRAEWTAWARQRYRRVARKAGESLP